MGKIAKMNPHLANMIAAGEVVEKPASVVKELVENAIDAKAKNITIILKNGGLDLIKVIDDGEGMDEEDVRMAFVPHATSKIKNEYDLFRILSLGFRGEAIPSIASVSNMQIVSSQDGIVGYNVLYEAGIKKSEGVMHHNIGTTITVKNLFFNTPARLKYLKPAKNELAAITYLMDRMAIANKDIRFTLISDDKIYLKTTASNNIINLMGEIYGLDVAKNLLESNFVIDGVEANMILVKPQIYRSNKLEITLIINGRFVKNYVITNAVVEAYNTFLPIGKYPIVVLNLKIDPLLVDINVHPSKTEIKISNEESIAQNIKSFIKDSLTKETLIPERKIIENKNNEYIKTTIFEMPKVFKEEATIYNLSQNLIKNDEDVLPNSKDLIENDEDVLSNSQDLVWQEENISNLEIVDNQNQVVEKLPYFEYVGQAFGTYLIFQNAQGLFLMDQHAAAERINYEKYYKILGEHNHPKTDLIVPLRISFTKSEVIFLENHQNEFDKLGFVIEPISDQDYVIRSIPLWANLDNALEIVRDIFALLYSKKEVDVLRFRDDIAKQISCKASIKANKHLNNLEIDTLIKNLNQCENPWTCPHGRPTIIKFSVNDLERMFERIQK